MDIEKLKRYFIHSVINYEDVYGMICENLTEQN